MICHPASGLDNAAADQVRAAARTRILRAFVGRGLIEPHDAKEMLGYQHDGGFSVDSGVCIAVTDQAGLERLLRYCARPPFAMDRLRRGTPALAGATQPTEPEPSKRSPANYLWAALIARLNLNPP